MKNISIWAKHHRWQTRFIIVFIYIILNAIGFFIGDVLYSFQIVLPAIAFYGCGILFLLGIVFYPIKKYKWKYKNFYVRQKTADLTLITTTFLLLICLANNSNVRNANNTNPFPNLHAVASVSTTTTNSTTSIVENPSLTKKEKKDLKKKLKENIKLLRKEYKSATKGEKTALIILSVLIAMGLLGLLGALACNISCGGAEGLAILVGVLGTGLIIFLLVRVIKNINRKYPKTTTSTSG